MRQILEGIARTSGNAAARIAAIKQLREMDGDAQDAGDFDKLDQNLRDEVTQRRDRKEASA